MSLTGRKILAIDDTPSIRTFLKILMEQNGAEYHEAANASEGLNASRTLKPDLIVLDLGLPDRDGLDLLPDLKADHPATPVIVLTVRKERQFKEMAFERGARAYVTKPFMMDELLEVMEEALGKR